MSNRLKEIREKLEIAANESDPVAREVMLYSILFDMVAWMEIIDSQPLNYNAER